MFDETHNFFHMHYRLFEFNYTHLKFLAHIVIQKHKINVSFFLFDYLNYAYRSLQKKAIYTYEGLIYAFFDTHTISLPSKRSFKPELHQHPKVDNKKLRTNRKRCTCILTKENKSSESDWYIDEHPVIIKSKEEAPQDGSSGST